MVCFQKSNIQIDGGFVYQEAFDQILKYMKKIGAHEDKIIEMESVENIRAKFN